MDFSFTTATQPQSDDRQGAAAPDFFVRLVTSAPTDAVVELYRAGGWWEESEENRAAIPAIIRGSFAFAVAVDSKTGAVVGMGRVISDGVSDAYIQDVVVLKQMRGKGIGGAIIRALTDHCRAQGIGWLGLIGEPGTDAFYERLGFHILPGFVPRRFGIQR